MGCGASKEHPHEPQEKKQGATAEGRISAGSDSPPADRPPPAALRTGTSSARTSHAPSLPHSVSEPSRYHSHLAHREGSIFTQNDKAFEQYQQALAAEEGGNLKEAEQFYNKCLEINVQELGEDHVNTLTCLSLVAAVLHAQDKLAEAESFCRRALDGRERVLGPEHEDTIASVSGLAALLHAQDKLKEAEPLYVRALQGREKSLGPAHPETLSSVQNLSALMYTMGRYR
jgi:tetratricopeptide (TPR) repeat protein